MDFDKQFGGSVSGDMVRKGRGFTEKPIQQHNPIPRQTNAPSTHKKITRNSQFVVYNSRTQQRGPRSQPVMERRIFNGRGTHNQPRGGRGVNYRQAPMRRGNHVAGGRNGRNGRNGHNRNNGRRVDQVSSAQQLNDQLDNYFNKDADFALKRLDNELDRYMEQTIESAVQPTEEQTTQPMQ